MEHKPHKFTITLMQTYSKDGPKNICAKPENKYLPTLSSWQHLERENC